MEPNCASGKPKMVVKVEGLVGISSRARIFVFGADFATNDQQSE
jgi:hypothetical protein